MHRQQAQGCVDSVLAQGSRFEGTAVVEGTLRVDGRYEGTLEAVEAVVIGKSGEFGGDIHARDVVICGSARGRITATGSVELQRGSRFEGDLQTRTLIVEEGVFFQGNCRMDDGIAVVESAEAPGSGVTQAASHPARAAAGSSAEDALVLPVGK